VWLKLQHAITGVVEANVDQADYRNASKRDRMRMMDLRGPGASAAMLAMPNCAATTLTNLEYTLSARNRYGMALDLNCTHCGACGHEFLYPEEQTTHFQCCVKYRKTTVNNRHDAVGKHTTTIGRRAGAHTSWEKRPDNGSRKRPDGGYHLSDGTILTDTTIRHPVTPTTMKVARPKLGSVLNTAVKGKVKKYKELARQEGARFTTLAISAYGHFHKDHLVFLKKLSWEALSNGVLHSERERVVFYRQAVSEIAVTLDRMNAKIFIRGLQDSRSRRWMQARCGQMPPHGRAAVLFIVLII
jgi:hypothetical protein